MCNQMIYKAVSTSRVGLLSILRICSMILLLISLLACSKQKSENPEQKSVVSEQKSIGPEYESPGPEFKYEFEIWKEEKLAADNQMQTNYNVTNLKINGHTIELSNVYTITEHSTNIDSSLVIETKNYGPMKINVHKGDGKVKFSLELLMTREQKAMIKDLKKSEK